MTERIIDLSDTPVRLSARGELLVIKTSGKDGEGEGAQDKPRRGVRAAHERWQNPVETTAPFAEIAAVVVSHPQVSFTQAVLARLAGAGAALVVCDEKQQPAAMMLPLDAHYVQAERIAAQAEASLPLRKRMWQQVVSAKIAAQSSLLKELRGSDYGLAGMAERVRPGDPDNLEAQAARRYWPVLFNDPDFIREREGGGQNPLLNYGYAALRATVCRAICASGLHPSIGLHHHNRYDTFRLASDLMEPYRPIVDRAVFRLCPELQEPPEICRDTKAELLAALMQRVTIGGESRTVFDAAARTAASLAAAFAGGRKKLILPEKV